MIILKNLSKTYSIGGVSVRALKDISIKIHPGEFVAISGPSGSGKSTLLHILGLLDKPDTGCYELNGKEVSKLSQKELAGFRNEYIGFVFQLFNLLPRLSAKDNVSLPLIYTPDYKKRNFMSPEDLLKKMGLGDRINHSPNELSGGEQQRVAIARAILKNPGLILADEPTGNLDSTTAKEIMGVLKDLNKSGITVVMITHEEELAKQTNRIIKLFDGKVVSDEYIAGKPAAPKEVDTGTSRIKLHRFNVFQFKNYFIQAVRSLVSNKTRSFLSILGVLIGVTAVIAMLALGTGAREDIKRHLAHLGTNILSVRVDRHRKRSIASEGGAIIRFTIEDGDAIRRISLVKRVSPIVSGGAQVVYGNKNRNTSIVGVAPDYEYIRASEPEQGRFFNNKEMLSRSKVALLGKTVAEELFEQESPLGKTVKINRVSFKVIGLLPEKGTGGWRDRDDQILIPLNTAMYRLMGKKHVDSIEVEIKDEEDIPMAQARIRKLIARRHKVASDREDMIDVRNWAEIQEAVSSTAKTFSWLLGSIAFISLLVGGIGIMNIMLVSVTERTREIGLRKAIGADNKDILSQFIIEAVVICLLGGVAGILLGTGIAMGLAGFAGWSTRVSLSSVMLAFIFSALIGLFFGIWPARKAANLNPIDALRYE